MKVCISQNFTQIKKKKQLVDHRNAWWRLRPSEWYLLHVTSRGLLQSSSCFDVTKMFAIHQIFCADIAILCLQPLCSSILSLFLSTVLESIYEISLMFLSTDQNSFIGRSPYSLRRHSLLCSKAHGCFRWCWRSKTMRSLMSQRTDQL